MRWLVNAFFALAVFTTAGGGFSSPALDCGRASACECGGQAVPAESAPHACCGGMEQAQATATISCPSHTPKCGTSPTAALQFDLTRAREAQGQDLSFRTHGPEPKPWPLAWVGASSLHPTNPALATGAPTPLWRLRSWAEASLPGQSALDHLTQLSIFRI